MYEANTINKIKVNSTLEVMTTSQVPLLFTDDGIVSRMSYSLVDRILNLIDQPANNINLYLDTSKNSRYYEYSVPLKSEGVLIYGSDMFNATLSGLSQGTTIVFINGYKLKDDEFKVIDDMHLKLLISAPNFDYSKVIIYNSIDITKMSSPVFDFTDTTKYTATVLGYTKDLFIFFKNGYLISPTDLVYAGSTLTFNIPINFTTDYIEYYVLSSPDSANYYFEAVPGVFSYGKKDEYGNILPELYNTVIKLDNVARLLIDDLRPGFFIKEEETVGSGILEIIDTDYESQYLKCLQLSNMSKDIYNNSEYFVQVPDTRSILHYLSDYDLKQQFLPEILGSFQKLLLNETYDSLVRINNLRSIERVNSKDIVKLLDLLGNKVNVTQSSLTHKHNVLDELTNFFKVVGVRKSYNFYNLSTSLGGMIKIDQLYTPIKDGSTEYTREPAKRYITFATAEELGAVRKREYRYPYEDYGQVNVLANPTDTINNSSKSQKRSPGELECSREGMPIIDETTGHYKDNEYFPQEYQTAFMKSTRSVYINTAMGESELIELPLKNGANQYIVDPVRGPNEPTEGYDYGSVEETAVNFYDYGYVSDKIQGHWVEWLEWDRPVDWYPTNHVDISLSIPPGEKQEEFTQQFLNTFYEIASAVLYIHKTINVYNIAKTNKWQEGDDIQYGIMTAPIYQSQVYVLTSDPRRQVSSN